MNAAPAQLALWLLLVLPAGVGGVLALARPRRGAAVLSVATASVTAVLSVVVALSRPSASSPFLPVVPGGEFAIGVDGLSALMVAMIAVVTLLVLLFSCGDPETQESPGRFHGLMLLFAAAALLTATAQTLPALLLGWEVMGAMSFALIGFRWQEGRRVSAGTTAFLTTRVADLGLYVAAAAALAGGAGLVVADLPVASAGWRDVLAAGVLVAALGKAAQLPFSFWLSRAMEGPSPVSALLHSAAMVAMGGYLLLRAHPLLAATGWASGTAAWIGALTALVLGVVAVGQRDLKQLLAASTSAQLGFVVLGAGLGATAGATAHLLAHAATKAALFLAAGAWLTALGTKDLAGLRGVARRWRVLGWSATIAALSLAGVAPLALWATKDAVLAVALERSPGLAAVGLAAAALSAAYAGSILVAVWSRVTAQDRDEVASHRGRERPGTGHVGALEQAPLVVLALGAAGLGVLALPPLGDALTRAVGGRPSHPGAAVAAASALPALVVLALVWWRRAALPTWAPRWTSTWLGLDAATQTLLVRPTLGLAHRLARFDDHVLDRAVTGGARGLLRLARGSRVLDDRVLDGAVRGAWRGTGRAAAAGASVDDRRVDGAVEGIATGLRRLGGLARRPQSGLVHQYYVQAVAILALGALLLIAVS